MAFACSATGVSPAHAADLAVTVNDASGASASQAVVLARSTSGALPPSAAATLQVTQRMQTFAPEVLAVPVGTTVQFPNLDRMRHHVYSFSPANTFEIRLYSGEDVPSVRFDNPGVVAIGCNIHDWMQGFIYVTDARFFALTDETGAARLTGLPNGEYHVSVWHPQLDGETAGQSATVATSPASLRVTLDKQLVPLEQRRPDDDPLLLRFHGGAR